ncbi:hypothetical protein [uncultured Acetatifactor sp.]|uniref:hypothetical protein n=1 Tax=uncultured Acetatifactor sp. TaxID=1671927 RepID=UPI002631FBF6|nr:hypothetical protein [uncultured Acetatifactor sp.]
MTGRKLPETKINGIPQTGPDTGNYWCTWDTQYRVNGLEAGKDTKNLRNVLNQEFLFGEKGMLTRYFKKVRQDLYVLLDDGWDVGWDVPGDGPVSIFGSLELFREKFPDCTGEPWERLAKMREKVCGLGYRGLGLWICANGVGEKKDAPFFQEEMEAYWRERAIWCRKAGVDYWKVDWGYHCQDIAYRDWMTRIVKTYAPDLKVEHAFCRGPLGGEGMEEASLGRLLACSDYFRTYDLLKEFTYSTTISRIQEAFRAQADRHYGCRSILNGEDAPMLEAALGCSIGVMRHPCWGGTEMDVLEMGLRWNEVERALRWQRIAPSFGLGESVNLASEELLEDWTDWLSGPEADGWLKEIGILPKGGTVRQKAPAILARNMEFPLVEAPGGEKAFLACSRHPETGAVSIGFLPRTCGDRKLYTPRMNVTFSMGAFVKPMGIFGEFAVLTVLLEEPVEGRIYLQDLCREEAVGVTELIMADNGRKLVIDYVALKERGWLDNDQGDVSAPGFMLWQEM